MRIKINNDYKCFMSIPNINYWYDDEGNPVFTTPGAQYIISDKIWWRDLTAPEKEKN